MGWLELLPLLKRLLPLLSRMVPMLETFVLARAATGKEADAKVERVAAELKGDFKSEFAAAAENHALLTQMLGEHTEQMRLLNTGINQLRVASGEHGARLQTAEAQIAVLARLLKGFAVAAILLLIVCAGLLMALFLRH